MGTEPALRDELRELRLRSVRADRGGVHFEGSLTDGMRACFHSRVAQRILLELAAFDAPNEDALYEGVRSVTWAEHLSTKTSFAVRASWFRATNCWMPKASNTTSTISAAT